jgi:hypothetical protein
MVEMTKSYNKMEKVSDFQRIIKDYGKDIVGVSLAFFIGSSLNRVGKGTGFVIPRFARGWLAVSERDARHRSFPVGLGPDVALEGDAS